MTREKTILSIRWYNPVKRSFIKKDIVLRDKVIKEEIIKPGVTSVTTFFEHGDWTTLSKSIILEYSRIEDVHKPTEPGYNIYDINLVKQVE